MKKNSYAYNIKVTRTVSTKATENLSDHIAHAMPFLEATELPLSSICKNTVKELRG